MKKLTIRQVAQLKRTAQNVYPLVNKKNKLVEQMEALNNELAATLAQIDAWEGATKAMTGGYTSEDLITRSVVDTGKVDKNGVAVKVTKYEPKDGVLVLNEADNVYEIIEIEEPEVPATLDEAEAVVAEVVDNTFDPTTL